MKTRLNRWDRSCVPCIESGHSADESSGVDVSAVVVPEGLVCPACRGGLTASDGEYVCGGCATKYRLADGVPVFSEEIAKSYDGYDAAFFPELARVEEANFWFKNRNRLIQRALARHFPDGGSFLEIGCGTGFVLTGVKQTGLPYSLAGSEIHLEGLAFARSRLPDASFYQVDARQLPFADAFDVIGAFDVIEHIDEDDTVLAQMRGALKDGGGIMLTVPQHGWLWSEVDAISGHKRRYEPGELEAKVEAAGFSLEYTTSFVSLLLPAIWLSRKKADKTTKTSDDVMKQFEIGTITNEVLFRVLQLERTLLQIPSVTLPLGSSRLVIARAV